ncbi:MAG TPA: lysylphosphatidylglycerol synthase transmembrane domain-containing protein [Blastocatellia bacterium]|nr:lysylphosphatidylglycerol synthase transmembrane domain-containing protein [Blastocatellia bacterium]
MKKTAITVFKIAVSLGILALILRKVDFNQLWDQLRSAHPTFVLASIAVYLSVQLLSAYRWYMLLRPIGVKTPYSKLLSIYLLGMYFNFFLPTAIGGDAVRVYYLNKETRKLSRSTASVFLDRDIGMAALLTIATVSAAIAGTKINDVPLAPIFALITVPFVIINLALFYRPSYNLLHRVLSLFKMKKADEKVEHLFESVNSYRGEWGVLSIAMVLSIIIQLGGIFANVVLGYAIGLETTHGWLDFLVFIPAISLISMNPLSMNGTGWREYSYLLLFESVGATSEQATALAVLWLGVLVATSLPGGVIYVLRGSRGKGKLAAEAETFDEPEKAPATLGEADQFSSLSGHTAEEKPLSTI